MMLVSNLNTHELYSSITVTPNQPMQPTWIRSVYLGTCVLKYRPEKIPSTLKNEQAKLGLANVNTAQRSLSLENKELCLMQCKLTSFLTNILKQ